MVQESSPSSVLYAQLKALGISNYDAALILFEADRSFGGSVLRNRIESRTQLSRVIVHAAPGAFPKSLFRDFARSSKVLISRIAERYAAQGDDYANEAIINRLTGDAAAEMQDALASHGLDSNVYRNALMYLDGLRLDDMGSLAHLHMMLFVATGCMGDPGFAVREVEGYCAEELGIPFRTPTTIPDAKENANNDGCALGLVRIVGGRLKGMDSFHWLSDSEQGTVIGSLAAGDGAITDVDADVSRRHARVFKRDGRWYIIGLDSLNGITVIKGDDKAEYVVEPPRSARPRDYSPEPFEILPTDVICLGATTRYMVMPMLG